MKRSTFHLLALSAAGALLLTLWAFAAGEAVIEPDKAGPEYAVQGEYAGKYGDHQLGCQVIALGNGAFQAVFLPGGLPGDGWNKKTRIRIEGKSEGEETHFGKDDSGWKGCLIKGEFSGETDKGEQFFLKKVTRQSMTMGKKAPEGATVLFDGNGAEQWNGGRVTAEGLLQEGTQTKKGYGSSTLHLEFMTPFQPAARSQGRGNSGVFLDGRYEVQILDSFGLEGKNNECGGIYSIKAPDVNMCYPPLTWQTFDIEYQAPEFDASGKKTKNAVATVRHNGVLIHNRVEIPRGTAGGQEGPMPGVIQLQNHGNPIRFRNIWIVEKK